MDRFWTKVPNFLRRSGLPETGSLSITHAGFWDHRGGTEFTARTSFADVRRLLEARGEEGIRAAFSSGKGGEARPHQVGCGRLELAFANGLRPILAELDIRTGRLEVALENEAEFQARATVRQSIAADLAWIECAHLVEVRARPVWDFIGF